MLKRFDSTAPDCAYCSWPWALGWECGKMAAKWWSSQPRPQGLLASQFGGGLAHSELKRSLIGVFRGAFIYALWLVYYFQSKDVGSWVLCGNCLLLCLRPKKWGEFLSDRLENCESTVRSSSQETRRRFEDSSPINKSFNRCSACVSSTCEFQPNQLLHTFTNRHCVGHTYTLWLRYLKW